MIKKLFPLIFLVLISCSKPTLEKDIITIGLGYEPESLLPLFPLSATASNVKSLIFNNLLKMNEDLVTFSPELAKSYTFSDDSLKITFILNSNIYWHDDEKLTSNDVVFSHNLYTNKLVGWDGLSYKQNIIDVIAIDDTTVVYIFDNKTPFMVMDAVEGVILPKHILSKVEVEGLFQSDFGHNPIGSGPYKLTHWENQQYIQLEKHEKYFNENKPSISKIIFKIINEPVMMVQQIMNREIDMASNIPVIYLDKISQEDSNLEIVNYTGKDYDFIGWNMIDRVSFNQLKDSIKANPQTFIPLVEPHFLFGNKRIREAMSLAINKKLITEKLFSGNADPINKPYVLFGTKQLNTSNQYDISKAKEILTEEGWIDSDGNGILDKNGKEFKFTIYTNSGNIIREQILDILVEEYGKIGIKMIPQKVEPNYLVSDIVPNKKFDALLLGWNAGIKPDFTPLFHRSQYLHPFHLTGFYSPEFDDMNNKLLQSKNITDFNYNLDIVLDELSQNRPYTWLYTKNNILVYNKRIKNVEPSIISPYRYLEYFEL